MTEVLRLPEGVELEPLPMEVLVLLRHPGASVGYVDGVLEVAVSYLDTDGLHSLEELLAPADGEVGVALSAVHESAINLSQQLRMARHAKLHPEHVQEAQE